MAVMSHSMTGSHARWAVLWVGKKGWVCKEFENDFTSALQLYMKVKNLGAKGATLLCRNVGFPPPHDRRKMSKINRAGALWCPYCRELRRFKKKRGYYVEQVWVPEPNMQCPVCGITTDNHHVRKHNPALNPHAEVINNGQGSRRAVRRGDSKATSSKLTDAQRAAKRERAARRRASRRAG